MNIYGNTSVHLAALNGHLPIVKYLQETDLSEKLVHKLLNHFGEMPFHSACRTGKMNTVQYFIEECEMSVNTKSKFGATPLHYAAFGGHLDIAEYLVNKSNFDTLMCVDNCGNTPGHYAVFNKNTLLNCLLWPKTVF